MTAITATEISRFADEIMKAIGDDMTAGHVPADALTFAELQDHVDANQYVVDAGVPFGTDPGAGDEGFGTVNAVVDEVDRRLRARADA